MLAVVFKQAKNVVIFGDLRCYSYQKMNLEKSIIEQLFYISLSSSRAKLASSKLSLEKT